MLGAMQSGVASRSETAWRGVSGAVCNAARNIRCSCCPSLLQFVCPGSPQENNTLNNSLFVLRSVTIDRGAKQIVGAGTATAEVGCGSLCCYSNRAYSRTQTVRNTGTHNLPLHLFVYSRDSSFSAVSAVNEQEVATQAHIT